MKYAVLFSFDKQSHAKIDEVKTYLTEHGIKDDIYNMWHITVGVFETDRPELLADITEKFAKKQKAFRLTLSSIGIFPTLRNTVFFMPTITEELRAAHQNFRNLIDTDKIKNENEHYSINKWTPHCGIANHLTDYDMVKTVQLLRTKNILPLEITLDKICLLQVDAKPHKVIAKFKL